MNVRPIANTIWTMIEGVWLFQANQDMNMPNPRSVFWPTI